MVTTTQKVGYVLSIKEGTQDEYVFCTTVLGEFTYGVSPSIFRAITFEKPREAKEFMTQYIPQRRWDKFSVKLVFHKVEIHDQS